MGEGEKIETLEVERAIREE